MVKLRSNRPLGSLLASCALAASALAAPDASADTPSAPPAKAPSVAAPSVAAPPVAAPPVAAPPVAAPPVATVAVAPKPPPDEPVIAGTRDPVMQKAEDDHRSGFAVNLSFGNGVASVVGYPNEPEKIGYARYYYESGARPGGFNTLWLGGAITDWFVFGVGFSGSSLMFTGQTTVAAGGLIFHTEIFPLYYRGGIWKDIAIAFDAGLGSGTIRDDSAKQSFVNVTTPEMKELRVPYFTVPQKNLVDGGSASQLGIGVLYEAAKVWRVRIAPMIYANYIWSDTVRRPGIFLGVHGTLYWKPSKN